MINEIVAAWCAQRTPAGIEVLVAAQVPVNRVYAIDEIVRAPHGICTRGKHSGGRSGLGSGSAADAGAVVGEDARAARRRYRLGQCAYGQKSLLSLGISYRTVGASRVFPRILRRRGSLVSRALRRWG